MKFAEGGGGGYSFKNNDVAIYKEPYTMRYILISKKHRTFHYVYIHIIYSGVLIPNYKRTYDQSD